MARAVRSAAANARNLISAFSLPGRTRNTVDEKPESKAKSTTAQEQTMREQILAAISDTDNDTDDNVTILKSPNNGNTTQEPTTPKQRTQVKTRRPTPLKKTKNTTEMTRILHAVERLDKKYVELITMLEDTREEIASSYETQEKQKTEISSLQKKCSLLENENATLNKTLKLLTSRINSCEHQVDLIKHKKSSPKTTRNPSTNNSQPSTSKGPGAKNKKKNNAHKSLTIQTNRRSDTSSESDYSDDEDDQLAYNVPTANRFVITQNNPPKPETNHKGKKSSISKNETTSSPTKKVLVIADGTAKYVDASRMYSGNTRATVLNIRRDANLQNARHLVSNVRMRPDHVVFCVGTSDVTQRHHIDAVHYEAQRLVEETQQKWPDAKILLVPTVPQRCTDKIPGHEAKRRTRHVTNCLSRLQSHHNRIKVASTEVLNDPMYFNKHELNAKGTALLVKIIKENVAGKSNNLY
jgi:hypothetical protein